MKVYFNDTELEIFSGAQVKDALLMYSQDGYNDVIKGIKQVIDKWNNQVELDGELTDGQHLYLTTVPASSDIPKK